MGRFGIILTDLAFYAFLLYGIAFGMVGIVRRKLLIRRGSLVRGWKAVVAGCFCIAMVVFLAIFVGEMVSIFDL
jgi:hypothetical protein